MAIYEGAHLFDNYVDYFYDLKTRSKAEGNKPYTTFAKLMLNSLYGKFGQRRPVLFETAVDDLSIYSREEVFDTRIMRPMTTTTLMGKSMIQIGEEPDKKAFAAIAAHITEYARLLLWKIISDIGVQRVLYCDTDSVLIRSADNQYIKHPIHATNLGALSLHKEYKQVIIYGAKDYELDATKKIKGVPKTATLRPDGGYEFDQFLSQVSHLRMQVTDYFVMRRIIKYNKRVYTKGLVLPNGRVIPLTFSDSDETPTPYQSVQEPADS